MLTVENFSFAFAERPVLSDISFHLPKGGYVSVIGPNGAGKSTLLKCLMRLHEYGHTDGTVTVADKKLESYSQRELATLIGYVPQAGGWVPPFSVMELLRLSRYPHLRGGAKPVAGRRASTGRGVEHYAIERALVLTHMTDLAYRPLKQLSGGERQKAFLAAALAQGTNILLLDEPASFLDPRHAAALNALLRTLNTEQGLTMLVVTHDLNHPLAQGGDTLVLKEGRRLFFGPVNDMLTQGILETAFEHEFIHLLHPRTGLPVVLAE